MLQMLQLPHMPPPTACVHEFNSQSIAPHQQKHPSHNAL